MAINGMEDFQRKCRLALCQWYQRNGKEAPSYEQTYVVWCCKTLKNYKCLVSTSLPDTIYAEYTHNGDSGETYGDAYEKLSNYAYAYNEYPFGEF